MATITEDYVSFEVANLLKEKGFNEPCFQMWECGPDKKYLFRLQNSCYQNITEEDSCLAPTHQMATKWLREKHNICIVIEPHAYDYVNEKNASYVASLWQGDNYYENITSKDYSTYEETVEAILKYILKNLI